MTLARGCAVLDVARIGAAQIAAELGRAQPRQAARCRGRRRRARPCARAAVRERAIISPSATRRTLVAISHGVDRSVAALLCAREGKTVASPSSSGPTPRTTRSRSCCSASAVAPAQSLRHSMGLPHLTNDLRSEFRTGVVEPFIAAFAGGETPNPCVGCNGHVRLDAMLDLADRLGCERLATGHYARVAESDAAAGPLLRVAADPAKDQTYMLAALLADVTRTDAVPAGGHDEARGQERSPRPPGCQSRARPTPRIFALPRRNHPGPLPRPPRGDRRRRRGDRRGRRHCRRTPRGPAPVHGWAAAPARDREPANHCT